MSQHQVTEAADDVVFSEASDADRLAEAALREESGDVLDLAPPDSAETLAANGSASAASTSVARLGAPAKSVATTSGTTVETGSVRTPRNQVRHDGLRDGEVAEATPVRSGSPADARSSKSVRSGLVRRMSASSKPANPAFAALAMEDPVSAGDAESSSFARALRWAFGLGAAGYAISFLLHGIVILSLGMVVVAPHLTKPPPALTGDGGRGGVGDSDVEGLGPEGGSGSDDSPNQNVVSVDIIPGVMPGVGDIENAILQSDLIAAAGRTGNNTGGGSGFGSGNSEGPGTGDGKGLPFAMPGSGKVTRKGSFSVWTVPEDPEPEKDYKIVIQIQLPENLKKLPRRDLEGSYVLGTDKYKQAIPRPITGYLPGNATQVQLVVHVPGARELVRDKIFVKSRALKEEQTIEIEF